MNVELFSLASIIRDLFAYDKDAVIECLINKGFNQDRVLSYVGASEQNFTGSNTNTVEIDRIIDRHLLPSRPNEQPLLSIHDLFNQNDDAYFDDPVLAPIHVRDDPIIDPIIIPDDPEPVDRVVGPVRPERKPRTNAFSDMVTTQYFFFGNNRRTSGNSISITTKDHSDKGFMMTEYKFK